MEGFHSFYVLEDAPVEDALVLADTAREIRKLVVRAHTTAADMSKAPKRAQFAHLHALGLSHRRIATWLDVSVRTVENRSTAYNNALRAAQSAVDENDRALFRILVECFFATWTDALPLEAEEVASRIEVFLTPAVAFVQSLQPRTQFVADLRQRGLSNRCVAERLGISKRCVEWHNHRFANSLRSEISADRANGVWLLHAIRCELVS